VAFNAWHWIDPHLRYAKPHELLRPGGVMVVGGCQWAQPAGAERFWTDVQADYRAVGYEGDPPPPPEQIGTQHFPTEAGALPAWPPNPARTRSARLAAPASSPGCATGLSRRAGLS
jgi:hypothetical protein